MDELTPQQLTMWFAFFDLRSERMKSKSGQMMEPEQFAQAVATMFPNQHGDT